MKLLVKNYGAIKECSIDLTKKLYLFVGYNNTGKTYLTKLIYEIFNPETLNDFSSSNYNTFEHAENEPIKLNKKIIDKILKEFSDYLKEVIVKRVVKDKEKILLTKSLFIGFEYNIQDVKKHELKSGARIGVADTEIEIYNLSKSEKSLEIEVEHLSVDDIFAKLPDDFFDNVPKKRFTEQISSIKSDVSKTITNSVLNLLLQNKERPFFLPSNRIFILENAEGLKKQEDIRKKELSDFLVDLLDSKEKKQNLLSALLAKKLESEHPSYINHLINEILKLRSNSDDEFIKNGTGFYDNLLKDFKSILGGEIVYEKISAVSSRIEKFKLNKSNTVSQIDMDIASSSVNQLSTLYLYLKYWAKSEKNFLMIDEPEENLHPENQVYLLNILLEFLSSNRLLITTHSPLVAEIINNYLILGQLNNKDEVIAEKRLPDIDITPENTGIYYFQGEKIVEHKIDKYGTLFTSFKLAQEKIYDLGEYLSDQMYNQLNIHSDAAN